MLVALAPEGIPRIEGVGINQASLLFALGAAVASGLLFGAFPALHVSGAGGRQLLAQASRTSGAVAPRRSRRALMIVEVALALILLVGCGLMARTMLRLYVVDPGFRAERLLTARVILSGPSWNDAAKRTSFVEQILERVRAIARDERDLLCACPSFQLPFSSSAARRDRNCSAYTTRTGRRLAVKEVANPSLCNFSRVLTSVVTPTYSEPSAQRRM